MKRYYFNWFVMNLQKLKNVSVMNVVLKFNWWFRSLEDEDLIPEEQIVITLSHNNYIKRLPVSTYRSQTEWTRRTRYEYFRRRLC